jgi:hypothetical protein
MSLGAVGGGTGSRPDFAGVDRRGGSAGCVDDPRWRGEAVCLSLEAQAYGRILLHHGEFLARGQWRHAVEGGPVPRQFTQQELNPFAVATGWQLFQERLDGLPVPRVVGIFHGGPDRRLGIGGLLGGDALPDDVGGLLGGCLCGGDDSRRQNDGDAEESNDGCDGGTPGSEHDPLLTKRSKVGPDGAGSCGPPSPAECHKMVLSPTIPRDPNLRAGRIRVLRCCDRWGRSPGVTGRIVPSSSPESGGHPMDEASNPRRRSTVPRWADRSHRRDTLERRS